MQDNEVITFGCRLNAFESEAIRRATATAGLRDTIIVNTCAVTAEAERQARQAIRRARRQHPAARIIVTGCAAAIAPERYARMPEVDLVLDNQAKLQAASYLLGSPTSPQPSPHPGSEMDRTHRDNDGESEVRTSTNPEPKGRVRAFLQVQQGCDHRCTFCVIPYARGPSRSVLGQMARRLLAAVPELERLRLSSLDPGEIDRDFWRLLSEERRLMPHLHLSLQAGDDLILKRMRRRHSRADAISAARQARALRPEVALGADLIAGFPTETEDMLQRSLDLIDECGLAFVHVFPYSPRPGTPASRMPQLPVPVIKERAARLRQAGNAALAVELTARVGSETEVLVEQPRSGRAAFYAAVRFAAPADEGSIYRMRLVGSEGHTLIGVPVQ
jgi:threonylcarbamoyladenosine tRNA methylthiotransferase MtaB